MLAEYLGFRGFEVVAASSGEEALAQIHARPPTVVLMELQMPGITGWEATRRLKAHPDTEHIIVIALTARAMARCACNILCRTNKTPEEESAYVFRC